MTRDGHRPKPGKVDRKDSVPPSGGSAVPQKGKEMSVTWICDCCGGDNFGLDHCPCSFGKYSEKGKRIAELEEMLRIFVLAYDPKPDTFKIGLEDYIRAKQMVFPGEAGR
ncbi:hypothetical protein IID24_03340 [Patescibacteria group bacterium]|nr:hypothetical protein [Patescibacteria group bacterium]